MDINEKHPGKQLSPIVVTEFGVEMDINEEHSEKLSS
jgi:hypothetical protein